MQLSFTGHVGSNPTLSVYKSTVNTVLFKFHLSKIHIFFLDTHPTPERECIHMKEKSSFTTEKPIDYTQTKDAYEGQRESSSYQDTLPPNKKHPKKDKSSGE